MQTSVIIAAAGQGKRMGSDVPKQFMLLDNQPILLHTLKRFQAISAVDEIIVVVGVGEEETIQDMVSEHGLFKVSSITPGGTERQYSVKKGLEKASGRLIAVHDAARPLVSEDAILRLLQTAYQTGAAVLGVPVKDTVKIVNEQGIVRQTPERKSLWSIQTPQAFHREVLDQAYTSAEREGFLGTDESSLVERMGHPVHVVEGEYDNIKITTPEDIDIALTLMKRGKKSND